MPRTFTNNFIAQCVARTSKPYLVLEIDYGGTIGTKYYLDRSPASFDTSDGHRVPASGVDTAALVLQWPSASLTLGEDKIGYEEQTTVTLNDANGEMTSLMSQGEQQRKLVTVWRMFDDPSCVWGTDNAAILTGCLRPFDWSGQDNTIKLGIGDLSKFLTKSISTIASKAIFPNIPSS
jgi:hypothetical protein